jgi:alpha-1,6-mannosyltransferase
MSRPAPADRRPAAGTPWSVLASQHGLIGLIGATTLALGAIGVGYLPERSWLATLPVVDLLRTSPGSYLAKALVAIGAILLLRAWLLLGGDVRAGRITTPDRLIRMLWYWSLPLILVPPLFSQDVYSYVAQGNLTRLDYDPYAIGPSAVPGPFLEEVGSLWVDTPAPYGPLFLLLGHAIVAVTGESIFTAALLMRGLALVGMLLLARYLPRLARSYGIDPVLAVWVGLLNPLVLMHFVSGAHNDALMAGLIVAGLWFVRDGRPWLGIVVIALAGTIKAPALVALGFAGLIWAGEQAGLRHRALRWGQSLLVTAGVFLAVNGVSGLGFGWVGALDTPGVVRSWISPITTLGVGSGWLVESLGYGDHTETILTVARALATLAVLTYAAVLLLRPRASRNPVRACGEVLFLLAAFGPVIHPWYLLWGAVILAAGGYRRRELPIVVAATAALVVHGLTQSSATSESVLRVSDPVSAAIVAVAALIGIFSSRTARREILDGRAQWAQPDPGRIAA